MRLVKIAVVKQIAFDKHYSQQTQRMKNIWQKTKEQTRLPVHSFVAFIILLALLFLVGTYAAIRRNEKSGSDNSYRPFVYPTCTLLWCEWIAEQASEKQKQ
jgi:hypothetical protein